MASVNKAILIGRLGKDAELRYAPSGTPVLNLSVATSERFTSKDGQKAEQTVWHRIVVFGKYAESIAKFLEKGRQVYLEGSFRYKDYEDKHGVKVHTVEIIADNVQLLGDRGNRPLTENQQQVRSTLENFKLPAQEEYVDDNIPF
jgi:single-strand DNA-binding protein